MEIGVCCLLLSFVFCFFVSLLLLLFFFFLGGGGGGARINKFRPYLSKLKPPIKTLKKPHLHPNPPKHKPIKTLQRQNLSMP